MLIAYEYVIGGAVMAGEGLPQTGSVLTEHMTQQAEQQEGERQDLIARVENGESTGNELHDQLIRWRGGEAFDERLVGFYEYVNEAVTGRNDEPFAVIISDTERGKSSGCVDAGEVTDGFDYVVYGILTGEPLQLRDEEQGIVIPSRGWTQCFALPKNLESSHTPPKGSAHAGYIKRKLDQSGSDSVPLMPFEQNSRVNEVYSPDFQVTVGSEEIERALRERDHINLLNTDTAVSIAELHQQHDSDYPIPDFCKSSLVMHRNRIERAIQNRESFSSDLKDERARLQDQVDEIDRKIESVDTQQAHDEEKLQRIDSLQGFLHPSATQKTE